MNMGANLASVQTNWELAFLTSYIKDQPAWLGMKLNPVSQSFKREMSLTSNPEILIRNPARTRRCFEFQTKLKKAQKSMIK